MRDASTLEPRLAPPGRRSGEGSASILPYLLMALAAKPAPPVPDILRRRVAPQAPVSRPGQHH